MPRNMISNISVLHVVVDVAFCISAYETRTPKYNVCVLFYVLVLFYNYNPGTCIAFAHSSSELNTIATQIQGK